MSAPSITITVFPSGGRPDYWLWEAGRYLPSPPTKTPLLSAARALLEDGADPGTKIEMVHADKPDIVALRSTLGTAAGLTVQETGNAPSFRKWQPFPGREKP
jgi:hypothetical protein